MFATSSCLTNVDGSYVSLALKALRLGIATAYGAQIPLELAQDGEWLHAGANIAASLVLCLVAVWLGHVLAAALNALKGS